MFLLLRWWFCSCNCYYGKLFEYYVTVNQKEYYSCAIWFGEVELRVERYKHWGKKEDVKIWEFD